MIREEGKQKIYLDANIIYGFFKTNIQRVKKGEKLRDTKITTTLI